MEDDILTGQIIKCAFKVHNTLGFGFLEKVYENSLVIELENSGLKTDQQKAVKVLYDGRPVGDYVADLIVNDDVIVEIKSVSTLAKEHEVQLVNYLKATGKPRGLLINFGRSVDVKRKHLNPS
jgi:GxxExxY protein